MDTIVVNTAKPYYVYFDNDLIKMIGETVAFTKSRILIITDDNVDALYGDKVVNKLLQINDKIYKFAFCHGEDNKNKDTLFAILDKLSALQFDRNDVIIALGGGVVGDIAGFAAGIYMRGIKYIQMPTTFLSAIDSSVGGKTAINLGAIKNQIGVFNQPEFVLIDTELIKSCPQDIFIDGMGEGVKYALLCGGRAAEIVRAGKVTQNFDEFVRLCVGYKAAVVSQDEREGGLRRVLNLGHTVGHAVEALSKHNISHGTAVVYGIRMLCGALMHERKISQTVYAEIDRIIKAYFDLKPLNFNAKEIVEIIKNDKKADSGQVKIVYPVAIGNIIEEDISFCELERILHNFIVCEKQERRNDC